MPHPRAAERAFVLVPWSDVDPTFDLAGRAAAVGPTSLDGLDRSGVRPRGPDLELVLA